MHVTKFNQIQNRDTGYPQPDTAGKKDILNRLERLPIPIHAQTCSHCLILLAMVPLQILDQLSGLDRIGARRPNIYKAQMLRLGQVCTRQNSTIQRHKPQAAQSAVEGVQMWYAVRGAVARHLGNLAGATPNPTLSCQEHEPLWSRT